jgi:hypothetical protein
MELLSYVCFTECLQATFGLESIRFFHQFSPAKEEQNHDKGNRKASSNKHMTLTNSWGHEKFCWPLGEQTCGVALSALQDVFYSTHTCSSKANSCRLPRQIHGETDSVTKLNQRIILLFISPSYGWRGWQHQRHHDESVVHVVYMTLWCMLYACSKYQIYILEPYIYWNHTWHSYLYQVLFSLLYVSSCRCYIHVP